MPALYVHIPYCDRKCLYCDFYSVETFEHFHRFLDSLRDEIRRRSEALAPAVAFDSVFLGGGTPSLLDAAQMDAVLHALRSRFTLTGDAEITVECNPGTVTPEKLSGYRESGVNRLSFGVQSFHADDLEFLSRIHTPQEAEDAVRLARGAGFDNINIDLMFSLPGQTPERWKHNLERARQLGTEHLSCYSLTVEPGTPLARMVMHGMVSMPPVESDAELFEMTMETLEGWGYEQYEVSNYALPGRRCRHNLTYWQHKDYLGFGPSAHSTWKGLRWWNVSNVTSYLELMEDGRLPTAGGEDLSPEMLREEHIYLRLRSEGIDRAEFRALFGSDIVGDNDAFIRHCVSSDLLLVDAASVRLSRGGWLVCDEICAKLS